MRTRVDGGLFGLSVRLLLLAMAVWVGANFVRSVTRAMQTVAGRQIVSLAPATARFALNAR